MITTTRQVSPAQNVYRGLLNAPANLDPVSIATAFAAMIVDEFMVVDGAWYRWDLTRWTQKDAGRLIRVRLRDMIAENCATDAHWNAKRTVLLRNAFVRDVLSAASDLDVINVSPDLLDANPHVLNTLGGIFNLDTSEYRPALPGDLVTQCTQFAPDFESEAPLWSAALRAAFSDDALIGYVGRAMGPILTANQHDQLFFLAVGPGGSGKSTFWDTISGVLGSVEAGGYAGTLAPEVLKTSGSASHSTSVAYLENTRLAVAEEAVGNSNARSTLDLEALKRLAGNRQLNARKMYKDSRAFKATHTIVMVTNNYPHIVDINDPIWRRVRLIPHNNVVLEQEIIANERTSDGDLAHQLLTHEGPQILGWMLDGAHSYITNGGLTNPPAVKDAMTTFRASTDLIGSFIGEWLEYTADDSDALTFTDLHAGLEEFRDTYQPHASLPSKQAMTNAMTASGRCHKGRGTGGVRKMDRVKWRAQEAATEGQ